jgi:hypothetical protein
MTTLDENLTHLYENSTILNKYLKWVEGSEDERITSDMQTCAALSLGNLARTGMFFSTLAVAESLSHSCYNFPFIDQHCIDLVQKHHLEVSLLRLLQKTEDLRVQHAVVSILKNLSLPSMYA